LGAAGPRLHRAGRPGAGEGGFREGGSDLAGGDRAASGRFTRTSRAGGAAADDRRPLLSRGLAFGEQTGALPVLAPASRTASQSCAQRERRTGMLRYPALVGAICCGLGPVAAPATAQYTSPGVAASEAGEPAGLSPVYSIRNLQEALNVLG